MYCCTSVPRLFVTPRNATHAVSATSRKRARSAVELFMFEVASQNSAPLRAGWVGAVQHSRLSMRATARVHPRRADHRIAALSLGDAALPHLGSWALLQDSGSGWLLWVSFRRRNPGWFARSVGAARRRVGHHGRRDGRGSCSPAALPFHGCKDVDLRCVASGAGATAFGEGGRRRPEVAASAFRRAGLCSPCWGHGSAH